MGADDFVKEHRAAADALWDQRGETLLVPVKNLELKPLLFLKSRNPSSII